MIIARARTFLATTILMALALAPMSSHAATVQVLYTFPNLIDSSTKSDLVLDSSGNLYGTVETGSSVSPWGYVYKVGSGPTHTLSGLKTFNNVNGAHPEGGVILDSLGNVYGTTAAKLNAQGSVFRLDASNNYALTPLVTFDSTNGSMPMGDLLRDSGGNLYGTTLAGGTDNLGTVYKLDASNNYALTSIATFNGGNGAHPEAGLIGDPSGNFYGTTTNGGTGVGAAGTVFRLDASNNYALTQLATFTGSNGSGPSTSLVRDASGNLYGTTSRGGAHGAGTVFKLDASDNYSLKTLVDFDSSYNPSNNGHISGLIMDAVGNLFGTTSMGGTGGGTAFRLDAANNYALTTLVNFDLNTTGVNPDAQLVADLAGNLYGTTHIGGVSQPIPPPSGAGTVFEISDAGFVPEPVGVTIFALLATIGFRRRGRNNQT